MIATPQKIFTTLKNRGNRNMLLHPFRILVAITTLAIATPWNIIATHNNRGNSYKQKQPNPI